MAVIQLVLESRMKRDVINKLTNAGFVDGKNLENHTILNNPSTFWQHILENAKCAKNNSYIVYEILPDRTKIYGDGEGVIAELSCNINLFTISPSESEATFNLRKALEEEFSISPWLIDYNLYEYDIDTRLHHYSYTVKSIYGSDD